MKKKNYYLDDTEFEDYTDLEFSEEIEDEEIVERELNALYFFDDKSKEIPFEHEIRQIDDF